MSVEANRWDMGIRRRRPTVIATHAPLKATKRNQGLPLGNFSRILMDNTPAMPLNDAHSGGFFASGACE